MEASEYKGYSLTWTGWKPAQETAELRGQWLAARTGFPELFASSTGLAGPLNSPGMSAWIPASEGHLVTAFDSEKDLETAKQRTLQRLQELIDME